MKTCFQLAYELKSLIDNDKRIKNLDDIEYEINHDEEIMALSYNKDLKETYLNDALRHFNKDSEEVKKAHVEYYRASNRLNENDKIKEYMKAYSEVTKLFKEINDILFKDFKGVSCNAHCRR